MSRSNRQGLLKERYHVHEHPFEPYEEALRRSDQSKMDVPKTEVPSLPARFKEHYPANGMQDENAQASYRDDRKEDSTHVIEYSDQWEIHIDDSNPRFPDQRFDHLVNDAPVTLVLLVAVIVLSYHYN
ncbi:hypothetical protein ACERIT_05165 [Halopenitus sp. H-Gu1]|uniref:hypothetical protein n=1 Tax=Halopenitus sp. H-Gu1 TaxID=3242697 RepID=UPI00359E9C3E